MSKPSTVDDLIKLAGEHEVPVVGLLVAQTAQELIKRNEITLEQEADPPTIVKIYSKIGHADFMAPETAMLMLSKPRAVDDAMSWLHTLVSKE